MCEYEGGRLATYEQLEAARQIGLQLNARLTLMFSPLDADTKLVLT